jgi:hypothetical protein
MKTTIIKQEILMMIAPFSKQELCEKNPPRNLSNQSYADQLEAACWNGLLDELLSNILEKTAAGKRLCLWHTQQRASFVGLELCDDPQFTERHLSIDPYNFLPTAIHN